MVPGGPIRCAVHRAIRRMGCGATLGSQTHPASRARRAIASAGPRRTRGPGEPLPWPPGARGARGGDLRRTGHRARLPRAPIVLALLSGAPALVYEVTWTRMVGLLVGSEIEAISVVLVAFFGGLALGSRVLGARADRTRAPLRLYGRLEIAGGALALGVTAVLAALLAHGRGRLPAPADLALAGALVGLPSFVLGGTLPALVRSSADDALSASRAAGRLVAANTAGAVAGVLLAAAGAPWLGLRATASGAALAAVAIGVGALAWARRAPAAPVQPAPREAGTGVPAPLLALAASAGAATLAFEVLATRAATLRLGSSLYAWASVLALFLLALAAGNAALARRAQATAHAARDLGAVECAAAVSLLLGGLVLVPALATGATGVGPASLGRVALAVLPPAFLMGAAFPLLVRLGVTRPGRLGAAFGAVNAANTAGGIAGALAVPFALLPLLGLERGIRACAAANGLMGLGLLAWAARRGTPRWAPAAAAAALAAAALGAGLAGTPPADAGRVLHVAHGRQATAVVVHRGDRRDLFVDGDAEASTGGAARRTEELLAALPLVLHREPRSFLEVGLGSGITLGTAARFGIDRVACIEIAPSVRRAARFFAPDNGAVTARPGRVRIEIGDGRDFLARHPRAFDVIVGNTLHPWSVGATGLYSREYFASMAASLREGGLAVQWLPLERVGPDSLAALLRTVFTVFPEGELWWGDGNLLVLAAGVPVPPLDAGRAAARLAAAGLAPARLGLAGAPELAERRIAGAATVREVLGPGEVLSDDRPLLEARGARRRRSGAADPQALVADIAAASARQDPRREPLAWWLAARAARARGEAEAAERLARRARTAGLGPAREAHLLEAFERGRERLAAGDLAGAAAHFDRAAEGLVAGPDARFGLAVTALRAGEPARARAHLESLVAAHPQHAEAWNLLGVLRREAGDPGAARRAFVRALRADPFFPEALANAGLAAAAQGDLAGARGMLARLAAVTPLADTEAEAALRAVLAEAG